MFSRAIYQIKATIERTSGGGGVGVEMTTMRCALNGDNDHGGIAGGRRKEGHIGQIGSFAQGQTGSQAGRQAISFSLAAVRG